MKKAVRILALAFSVLMLLASLGFAEEPLIRQRPADAAEALAWAREQTWEREYTIGFANIQESDAVSTALGNFIVECCKAYGMNVIRTDNEADGMKAVKNVQAMLAQNIEGLVEFNVDESVGGVIMELLNEAGIPVVAIDIPHPGATFFGADNAYAGALAGKAVAEAALAKWGKLDCLLLVDQMASGDLPRLRVLKAEDGLREVFPDFPSDKVYIIEGGTSADVAQSATSAFLAAHPGEKIGIVCLQSLGGLGSQSAIEITGREDDCLMVVNNEDYFFSDVRNHPDGSCFYGAVTFQLTSYGQWIAPAMREILDTGVQPENVYVEHKVVTRDNIDELFPNWREDLANGVYPN